MARPRKNTDDQDFPDSDSPGIVERGRFSLPHVEKIGDEYFYTWKDLGYAIGFNFLRKEKDGIHGVISIVTDEISPLTGRLGLVHWSSFNLESDRTRSSLAKSLARKTLLKDDILWEHMVQWAAKETSQDFMAGLPEVDVATHRPRPIQWGIKDVLLKGESNVLYGPGGSLKSYLVDAMAVAFACGHPIGPFEPNEEGPVLLVDYETSDDEVASRCQRIAEGAGVTIPKHGIIYRQYWQMFADEGHTTRALVDRYKCVFVGVDSIAYAVGGQVVPQFVMPFFSVLRSLNPRVTKAVISHITKAAAADPDAPATEFGTAFVRNSARNSWEVSRAGYDNDSGSYQVAMYNRKINQGRERQPIYATVAFDGEYGPVSFAKAQRGDAPELMSKASLHDKLRWALRGGPKTDDEIAVAIGMKPHLVKGELIRQAGRIVTPIRDARNKETWALLDHAHNERPPVDEDRPFEDDTYQEDESYSGMWGTDDDEMTF